jgi:heat shock protein HslJ
MKKYLTLSLAIALFAACGPKTETNGSATSDTNKTAPTPADSGKTAVNMPVDTPKVDAPEAKAPETKTDKTDKTEPVKPVDKNERITINGKWTLTLLNGKKVGDKEFTNGLATLDINTVDNTGSGFGGCNRFNGSLTIFDGKRIKIEKVISTKMFCEGVPENEYMTALRSATNFSVVDGKLQLKDNSKKVIAVFVRGVK